MNFFNYDLPLTREFLAVHNTVPSGIWKGQPQRESMPMVRWIDETFKGGNNGSLYPNEDKVKAAIEKYTSGQFDVSGVCRVCDQHALVACCVHRAHHLLSALRTDWTGGDGILQGHHEQSIGRR